MKFQLQRKITIDRSTQNVYDILSNLGQWNVWSPWIHCEPTAKTQLSGMPGQVGQSQTWDGEVIGSGRMTITELEKDRLMSMKLEFFTPWKSVSEATFTLTDVSSGKSEVTWTLRGHLPFFMFPLKNMLMAYMGSDFDRGLKMLKEYAETGTVISKSVYQGEKDFSGFRVVGKKTTCPISALGKDIPADFNKMDQRLKNGELTPPDAMVTLSHQHDIPKGISTFTAGYVYGPGKEFKVPSDMEVTQLPAHKALVVDHYGPYRNIGNPWSMVMSYQRGKKKKVAKKIPMYEVYKTMPDGRPEKDIYTQIVMPIK